MKTTSKATGTPESRRRDRNALSGDARPLIQAVLLGLLLAIALTIAAATAGAHAQSQAGISGGKPIQTLSVQTQP